MCIFEDCDRKIVARGLCHGHWKQQSLGKPLTPLKYHAPRNSLKGEAEVFAAMEQNNCIIWPFGKLSDGYGRLVLNGKTRQVTQYICSLKYGPAPKGKSYALHTCDNTECVNYKHLYWGDNSDNMTDAVKRNRKARKLTNEQVLVIYDLYGQVSSKYLGAKLNVDESTIRQIWKGRSYRWLTGHVA